MKPIQTHLVYIAFIIVYACSLPASAKHDTVEYIVDITHPIHHTAEITAKFPRVENTRFEVTLPVWRTAKYKILNFPSGVSNFRAFGENGEALVAVKTNKNTWNIVLDAPQQVSIKYTLFANELHLRSRHIDDSHAYLDATASLMYAKPFRQLPVTVELNVPKEWQSRSGMEKANGKHRFKAQNYDVLASSPIETGIHNYHAFNADGKAHELVVWGQGNQNDKMILEDIKKFVPEAKKIWGDYPFERYVWMIHAVSHKKGATEHLNSTIIQNNRYEFAPRDKYVKFITTASHEFVHTWNVKAYLPRGISEYDFDKENYTRLLWLVEGSTSYFAPLLLVRSGVIDGEEYLDEWSSRIERHLKRPGRKIQSPAEASFDAWLDYSAHWNQNAKVNIYTEGMLASLVLDLEIRKQTDFKRGYEDVHRLMYERYRRPSTYTEADVKQLLNEVAGTDLSTLWQAHISGTQTIPLDELLNRVGLQITYAPGEDADEFPRWLGVSLEQDSSEAKIAVVERNSAAWRAGLTTGDTIIAINQLRANASNLAQLIREHKPGKTVTISFFRQDTLRKTKLNIAANDNAKLKVLPVDKPSQSQQAFFQAWAGIPLPVIE